MAKPAPIFVVGVARSGTTLLQALLGAHPRIAAPPEMHWFLRIHRQRDYWGELDSGDAIRRVVAETLDVPGGMLDGIGLDVDDVLRRIPGSSCRYRDVLDAVLTTFAEQQGKVRWSEKTPNQSPEEIWSVFPEAQLLHVVRDPRDVAASVARAPFTNAGNGIAATARSWHDFTAPALAAGRAAGPDRYLLVRYEDLCNDPDNTMAGIFGFLGEEHVPGIADDLDARRPAVAETAWWTHGALHFVRPVPEPGRSLRWGRRCLVARITRPLLTELGYRTGSPVQEAVGLAAYAAVRARDRLRRTPPAPPDDPAARHALVNDLIARVMAQAEQSKPQR